MQALDTQLDIIRWLESRQGIAFSYSWAESRIESHPDAFASTTVGEYARALHTGQSYAMGTGDTYAVSSEIFEVIDQAAAVLPDDAMITPADVPTKFGFIYFENPIPMLDDYGKPADIGVIAWAAVTQDVNYDASGVKQVSFRSDGSVRMNTRPDPEDEEHGVLIFAYADRDGPNDTVVDELRAAGANRTQLDSVPKYSLWHWQPVGFDMPAPGRLEKLLFTFWRFIGETWIDSRMILPDRPARKRAIRAKVNPEVRVMRLRKSEVRTTDRGDGDDAAVIWSHRWIVEGHWRNQWYPSLQTHRPKWVPRHIKGPEDRPLILKDRVFMVDR
jgi:hypothetical protein